MAFTIDNELNQTGAINEVIPISATARVIYQLGEQLISDEFVALAELIKNAYDADCTKVTVDVDTEVNTPYGKGRIVIEDNGNGMTRTILVKSFLRISTTFKLVEKYSPHFKRRTLGEKGLGRLSIQRLGNFLTVLTSPRIDRIKSIIPEDDVNFYKKYNQYEIKMDWKKFSDSEEDISNVKANIVYSYVEKPKFGTKIIIEGIRNLDFWNQNKRLESRIRTEIFGMVNPFTQNKKQKFQIVFKVNNNTFSNEGIDENTLDLMSEIKVEFCFQEWYLIIKLTVKKRYYDRLVDELINKMKEKKFDKYKIIKPYEEDVKLIIIDFYNNNYTIDFPYLKNIKFQSYQGNTELDDLYAYPGDFKGRLYISDQSSETLKVSRQILHDSGTTFKAMKEIKSIWKAAVGVYIFRNEFRILPYGAPKIDWLEFTERSQRSKANAYKMHTVSGYVELGGLSSERLREQTNRQGLIEDEFGNNFFTLVRDALAEILFRQDTNLRRQLVIDADIDNVQYDQVTTKDNNIVFYRTKDTTEIKRFTLAAAKEEVNRLSTFASKEVEELIKQLKVLEQVNEDEEKKREQDNFIYNERLLGVNNLVELAGQGIIIEALTHELHRIESNISEYAKDTKKALLTIREELVLKNKNELIQKQERILQEIGFLNNQLKHLEPTYKKNRMIIENIFIKDFLEELYKTDSPMANKAKELNINVDILGDNFLVKAPKGILIILFDNLFINSLYWVTVNNSDRKISFNLDSFNNSVIIWDSGPGIHPDVNDSLFDADVSMKPEGRGLGLYIVKELIRSLNGNIKIDISSRNLQGNLYKFIISFPLID